MTSPGHSLRLLLNLLFLLLHQLRVEGRRLLQQQCALRSSGVVEGSGESFPDLGRRAHHCSGLQSVGVMGRRHIVIYSFFFFFIITRVLPI